jgi:signal peptidase I
MVKSKKRAFTSFGVSLLLILAFVIFFQRNFNSVIVSGPSMKPTLQNGEKLWASRAYWLVGDIKKGDIVVLHDPGAATGYIIKRVAFMSGDTVDWYNAPKTWPLAQGPFKVPTGEIYVLGDNRAVSEDSRYFGPVEISTVLGKVVVRP